jgi:putative ABC transport system ATP-binding protein
MNEDTLIQCKNISKTYKKGKLLVTPLEALDLEVGRGKFLALMGPSGSGKTTLLNLIAGIDSPRTGDLLIEGNNLSHMSRSALTQWRSTHCGYIFQLYHLVPILTAFENIEFPLLLDKSLSRKDRIQRVQAALDIVGLTDRFHHRPSELSGGQEQRVTIARAIVANPPLILADEPTGDLDRESATQILAIMKNLSKNHGKTIVMVTHDAIAAQAASRILHLDKGQLVEAPKLVVKNK